MDDIPTSWHRNRSQLDANLPRRRYCSTGCEVSQVGKADDRCWLCDGPTQTVMPGGWVM